MEKSDNFINNDFLFMFWFSKKTFFAPQKSQNTFSRIAKIDENGQVLGNPPFFTKNVSSQNDLELEILREALKKRVI